VFAPSQTVFAGQTELARPRPQARTDKRTSAAIKRDAGFEAVDTGP